MDDHHFSYITKLEKKKTLLVWVNQKIKNIIWKMKKKKPLKSTLTKKPNNNKLFLKKNYKKKSELKSLFRGREREREVEERLKRREEKLSTNRKYKKWGPARKLQVGEWVGEWLSEWVIQEATAATSPLIILSFLTVWSNLVLKIATKSS